MRDLGPLEFHWAFGIRRVFGSVLGFFKPCATERFLI
jgi:hypothetical protein